MHLDDLHSAQSGLVSNVLQKLVEGPLRPLRVGTDFGTLRPHFAQVFDSNGATMCSGVVYDHFGHDVIFVLGTSGLLALDAAQQPAFSLSLQVLLAPAPGSFRACGIEPPDAAPCRFPGPP